MTFAKNLLPSAKTNSIGVTERPMGREGCPQAVMTLGALFRCLGSSLAMEAANFLPTKMEHAASIEDSYGGNAALDEQMSWGWWNPTGGETILLALKGIVACFSFHCVLFRVDYTSDVARLGCVSVGASHLLHFFSWSNITV